MASFNTPITAKEIRKFTEVAIDKYLSLVTNSKETTLHREIFSCLALQKGISYCRPGSDISYPSAHFICEELLDIVYKGRTFLMDNTRAFKDVPAASRQMARALWLTMIGEFYAQNKWAVKELNTRLNLGTAK